MEGLGAFFIYFGITAGVAILFWAIFRFKVPNITFTLAKSGLEMAKLVAAMLYPNDKPKQDKIIKNLQLIIDGISIVEVSKTEIEAEFLANGWDGVDKTKLYERYTEKAIEIAKKLGQEQGITFDTASTEIWKLAVKFVLGFFRFGEHGGALESNQLTPGVHKVTEDKDGNFRPISNGQ